MILASAQTRVAGMIRVIWVICEGKSEFAYLQELNRYCREEEIGLIFNGEIASGGTPHLLNTALRRIRMRLQGRVRAYAMLDKDIYQRQQAKVTDIAKGITCMFNVWCFEDFLVLHASRDKVRLWDKMCRETGHYNTPLTGVTIENKLRHLVYPGYKKGFLPKSMRIDETSLQNLFTNNENPEICMHSDFAVFLKEMFEKGPFAK